MRSTCPTPPARSPSRRPPAMPAPPSCSTAPRPPPAPPRPRQRDRSATQITAVTPAHAAGAVDVAVTTPGGSATLAGAFTFEVPARPDPTLDPEVVGLLTAQADMATRFARNQTRNFLRRLEQLHREG